MTYRGSRIVITSGALILQATGIDSAYISAIGATRAPNKPVRRAGGGSRGREQVGKQVYWWFQVENMHGKAHLSMDVATESKVADTEGSTATPL